MRGWERCPGPEDGMKPRGALSWSALLLLAMPMCGTAVAQNASPADAAMGPKSAVQACIDRIDGSVTGKVAPKGLERFRGQARSARMRSFTSNVYQR